MKVTDIMTTDVQTCTMDDTLQEIAGMMQEWDVGSIPVMENDRLAGIITDRDLVIRGIASQFALDTPVRQILSSDLVTGRPDMDLEEAADLMAEHQIRRLPIAEGDKLLGIVSLGDVAVKDPSDMHAGAAIEDISKPAEPS
ncbi:CBS domain-containing protein [Planococcus liqunii]|uniref:CBS domain-containing protein n=1 Tax=Planococcus liqunii TaxID=3058394 RepID=A0ABT8MN96_9BACL|nr:MULTISPECIES: CBS domain-containing protein [unclassified Planococcus (in: firmicutes)]MDN7226371.1 CBS domain-containing protein [Planococcus sp. N064]WKA50145.1 CBS domain-containing protein [Planococcus sp. N056]